MLKKISTRFLAVIMAFGFVASAHGAIEKVIVVETQPKAHVPSVTLKNVYGKYTDVTSVKIRLNDADLEIPLQDQGSRTWEAQLSNEQVKQLLGDKTSGTFSAQVIIKSKNDKGRVETKEESAELMIQN